MADFTYDQIVTAQDLNNIAVDLGAGDFSTFTDNTPYAVSKLNEITSALVGKGISSALNSFELTINAENVVVGTGIAFFESGRKIKLDIPVTLPFQTGELYFVENQSTGNVSINIGELPEGNYIHIATINEDLTFDDKRALAKAKVELPSEGNSYYVKKTTTANGTLDDGKTSIVFPIAGITKIFIKTNYSLYVFDVASQTFSGVRCDKISDDPDLVVDKTFVYVLTTVVGSSWKTIILEPSAMNDSTVTIDCIFEAYEDLSGQVIEFFAFGGI